MAVRDMLAWFDGAAMIAAYNGRHFDMEVLKRYYDGDEARRRAHSAKLHEAAASDRQAPSRPSG